MKKQYRALVTSLLASTALVALSAHAQTSTQMNDGATYGSSASGTTTTAGASTASGSGYRSGYRSGSVAEENRASYLPYTTGGYVGLNLGESDYSADCNIGFSCDDGKFAGKAYTGGMINRYVGVELGYLHMGNVNRDGGSARAHGLNLSLVGHLPIANAFSAFGKVGSTYGRTRVSNTDGNNGSDTGFGLSYGAGLAFNMTRNWSAVLEWERHEFDFAGNEGQDVDLTSVGVKYRF